MVDSPSRQRSLLQNVTWLGVANVLVKPFWFVFITAACMRFLGVGEYGVMTAALSVGMIATALVDLGMTQFTVRELSRTPSNASLFFTNLMTLRLANSVVAWLIAVGAGILLGYRGAALVAVTFAGAYTLTLNLTNYCRSIYRAYEDLRQEAAMLVLEKVLVVAVGLTFLALTRLAHWTLAGMAAGMTLTTIANIWWINRHFARIRPALLSKSFLWRSVKSMVPFGLAGIFAVIYYRVDMVMIEAFLGEIPTGQYGAAYRIVEALQVLPTVVALATVYPRLSRLHHERAFSDFSSLLKKSLLIIAGVSASIAAILTISAPLVIRLLDPDPAYGPSVAALQILVWSFPFLCANSLLYSALNAMEHQRFVSISLGLAVLANSGLNLMMIPKLGINGAAISSVIPEFLLVLIYTWYYQRIRQGRNMAP